MRPEQIVKKLNSKGYFTRFYVMPGTGQYTIDVQGEYENLEIADVKEALGPSDTQLEYTLIMGRERGSIDCVRIQL